MVGKPNREMPLLLKVLLVTVAVPVPALRMPPPSLPLMVLLVILTVPEVDDRAAVLGQGVVEDGVVAEGAVGDTQRARVDNPAAAGRIHTSMADRAGGDGQVIEREAHAAVHAGRTGLPSLPIHRLMQADRLPAAIQGHVPSDVQGGGEREREIAATTERNGIASIVGVCLAIAASRLAASPQELTVMVDAAYVGRGEVIPAIPSARSTTISIRVVNFISVFLSYFSSVWSSGPRLMRRPACTVVAGRSRCGLVRQQHPGPQCRRAGASRAALSSLLP